MEKLSFGKFELTWLSGGITHLDGGAMFGVVPKPLWSKKYPNNDNNQIPLRTDPILVQVEGKNVLIESGIGQNKMNEKMKRNFGVTEESAIEQSLGELGLTPNDIDIVLMTHLHFDHACGLSKWEGDNLVSAFPNAEIISSEVEWAEMRNPNIRSRNTYWEDNWKPVEKQVKTFKEELEVLPGLKVVHTGGHSDGHAIVVFEENDDLMIHMADLMPTHAHQNVLWVMAYDDYPMDSIHHKQKWMKRGLEKQAWFTFYHDAIYRAVRWDESGKTIVEAVKRDS